MTSMIGVMQFVVQLAQEMMPAEPSGAFTPWTTEVHTGDVAAHDHAFRERLQDAVAHVRP